MIAPPQYKCEVVTLDKKGGSAIIEKAVSIVQAQIKKRGGIFKLVCGPTKIGAKGDDIERDDIIASLANNDDESSGEESNEEGMNIDLADDDINDAIEDEDEDEEEEKKAQ